MSEVVSIPQLRFPEFRDEWRVDKFVDLCKFQQGVQVDVELQSTEPKNNFLRFLRIENYTQKSNDFRYIPKELSSNKSITENEIAIVRYGATAGYIGRGLKGILANNLFKLVLNKDTLDTDYLFHLLRSYKTFCFFQSEMSGGAMPALSFGIVGALKLPYSSISEQQKIAAFLTVVDNKIEQLSKKQELLGEYKKGLMQQIFSQAIRFKADDGCDFPDWEEKSLGELFNYKNGGSFENEVVKDGLYNLITLNSITIDGELKNEHKKINSFDNSLKINDLIMVLSDVAHGNFLGLTAIIPEDNSYVLNQRMGALKSKGLNNVVFLRLLINYNQKYFKLHGQGSSQQNLSKGDILKFELLLPNRNEQQKIANFLSSIDTKIEQVGKQLDESKQFKKALLQQMFV